MIFMRYQEGVIHFGNFLRVRNKEGGSSVQVENSTTYFVRYQKRGRSERGLYMISGERYIST